MNAMNQTRRYAISALATVSLFATSACFDKGGDDEDDGDGDGDGGAATASIIGTWSLEKLQYDGDTYFYPYEYVDGGYSYQTGIRMKITSETRGDSYWYTLYHYDDGTTYFEAYDAQGLSVTATGDRTYDIQFEEDTELLMSCTLGASRLDCTGPSWEGYGEIDWVKVD
ncbi:MAG: hypothetical protein H6742_07965 [Alphaproteobacteria bacterium]|nr:hypothetical protein [Alphaproteobacteria bacterium]